MRTLVIASVLAALFSVSALADELNDRAEARLTSAGATVRRTKEGAIRSVSCFPLTSRVEDADLGCLEGLSGLKTIFLVETHVTDAGLARLAMVPALETLYLGGTQTDADGVTATGGTRLTDAGLAHVAKIKTLRRLVLAAPKLTDAGLASIEGMSELRALGLSGPGFTDAGLAHLVHLPDLEELSLADSSVKGPGLATAGLPRLRSLVIGPGSFDARALVPIEDIASLRQLMFYKADLRPDAFDALAKLTQVSDIQLTECRVPPGRIEALRAALPGTSISVSDDVATGAQRTR